MEYKEAFDLAKQYFKGDDLAATVFLGKYALKSPKGDIEEPTPEYMHRRLAKEFARIEAKYPNPMSEEEIFGLFKDFKYVVPQGSPMAGIGNPYQVMSLSNCFVEGTKVHTKKGVKNIENVDLGDEVLTHKGRYRKVVQLHKNKLDGRQLFSFKAYRTPEIKVTGNHEFMSISKEQLAWNKEPQFNPIQYLRQGDYIQIPQNLEEVADRGDLNLFSVFENGFEYGNHSYEAVEKGNGRFQLVTVTKDGKRRTHTNTTPKKLQIDEDFAYFLGLWYGDGCVFGENTKKTRNQRNKKCKVCSKVRGLTFTFGSHETSLINFVLGYLNRNEISFDKNDNKDNTTQIAIHNGALGYGFEHFFGRRFNGKRLAAFMHSWDRELVASLLRGLVDSDGTITKQGDVRVVMSNPDFIESVYHLARSHNFLIGISSTGKVSRLDFGRNDEFRNGSLKSYNDDRLSASLSNKTNHVIDINGTKFVQILSKQEISDNPAFVYTFGVEEDHSYSVEGLIAKNCFVIESPYDSYGGILKTDQEEAQLMKRRGGVGFDISTIRPKGIHTNNAAKTTDGIGVFMERFSNTCREVAQGGRRGALMLSISVHHPEIETFINIKRSLDKVTGANISVRVSDEFMNAVKANEEYEVRFPVEAGLDDSKYLVRQKIKAADIWNQLIEGAHASAEPGVLFWDTIKRRSPADIYPNFQTQSTNPCGEITLSPYDSCRLLLVNVLSFINNPFEDNASFNKELFIEVAKRAQRLMDDMVDLEIEAIDKILEKIKADPEPVDVKKIEIDLWSKIRQACVRGRRTGLGVTAIGDALAALNVRYGSEESVDWVEVFYKTLALGAYTSTVEMAEERGAFEAFDYELEKNHEFLKQVFYDEMMPKDILVKWAEFGRRNIALTTTAPAGSVSVLTQTTSGIEPAFEVVYTRRRKINPEDAVSRVDFVDALGDKWQEYKVYHHQFKKWMEVTGWENVEDSPYWKARANDVDWEASVDLQAAAQKWVCHAISKTCNLPSDVSVDLVKQVYERAWATGCKGFTIYRDGSRSGVLVTETKSDEKKTSSFDEHHAPKRPAELSCKVMHTTVKGERWTFFVGVLDDKPYEIMGGLSKLISIPKRVKEGKIVKHNGPSNPVARYDFHYDFEKGPEEETIIRDINKVFENATEAAFTRTLSLAMRHGTPVQYVVEQLLKGSEKDDDLFSFSRAVSRVLKSFIADGTKASEKKCSVCSSTDLIYQEGCVTCKACGNSKCG